MVVAIALAACATHPTGLELVIEPGQPGDTVDLYFGTTRGTSSISISGFAQYAISGATYYAADQLKPHSVGTKSDRAQTIITVEQPAATPALSFVLALEQTSDGHKFAAAAKVTQVETNAGALNSYTLTLAPVRSDPVATNMSGPFATVWQPDPTRAPPHPEDECEYFNGRDNLGTPLDVAIVVDADTFAGTSVAPYSDHDCDGFPHRDAMNAMSEECYDTVYDAVGAPATLDTVVCAGMYTAPGASTPYCYATAPVCSDGKPESNCPAADQLVEADNATNYCVPTAFCTACPTDLGCTENPSAGPLPVATCEVPYDQDSQVCADYAVTFLLPPKGLPLLGTDCTSLTPPYVQLGLPGEGFSPELDITDHGQDAAIVVSPSPDCTSATLTITGTWMQPDTTILLAISPPTGRGSVVAVDLTAAMSTDQCLDMPTCSQTLLDDPSFDDCLSQLIARQ